MDRELTPKQQTSEAIRQAESVLIMTGQHPSVDQVSATVALTAILRKFGKKATAVISDDIPASARWLPTKALDREMGGLRDFVVEVGLDRAEVDKVKYTIEDGKLNVHITPFAGGFKPQDVSFSYGDYQYDLVIILGVASYSRIDKVFAQNAEQLREAPLINIDFHRSNENYGAINLVEPAAASLSEILLALSESLQTGLIDSEIATVMLAGIMSATDRFTANHTTSKAMTVAAQMMAMGADQQQVVRGLYRERGGNNRQPNQGQPRRREPEKPRPVERKPEPKPVEARQPAGPSEAKAEPVQAEEPTPVRQQPLASEPAVRAEPQQVPTPVQSKPPAEIDDEAFGVTDPEDTSPKPRAVKAETDPEPLINDNSNSEPKPEAPARQKTSNPTNNPVFANRLP